MMMNAGELKLANKIIIQSGYNIYISYRMSTIRKIARNSWKLFNGEKRREIHLLNQISLYILPGSEVATFCISKVSNAEATALLLKPLLIYSSSIWICSCC